MRTLAQDGLIKCSAIMDSRVSPIRKGIVQHEKGRCRGPFPFEAFLSGLDPDARRIPKGKK